MKEKSSMKAQSSEAERGAPRRAPSKLGKARASRPRSSSSEAAAAKSRSERESREREAKPETPQRAPAARPARSVKVRPDWGY